MTKRAISPKTEELLQAAERAQADSNQTREAAIAALLHEQRLFNHECAQRLKALGFKPGRGHSNGASGYICRACGKPGHNARSCGRDPKP